MEFTIKKASWLDTWWAAGREFKILPPVDPSFAPENLGPLRWFLLRVLILPRSYRGSVLKLQAMAGGKRAGFLYGRQRGSSLHIDTLGVEEEFRRQGLARRMVSETLLFARQLHVDYLTAAVTPQNLPAIELFSSLEFSAYRSQRLVYEAEALEIPIEPGWTVRELSPTETQVTYDRWFRNAIEGGDAWVSDLIVDVYKRSGWRGVARHWACLVQDDEQGYLRITGLRGRYQAYLACAPQLWQETAQITWLKEAVDSYAYPLAGLVLEFSADAEFKASHPVWEQAGFKVEDRVRYLMIRSLRTA
jgi:GNAT superfamily N-acetyltransferase